MYIVQGTKYQASGWGVPKLSGTIHAGLFYRVIFQSNTVLTFGAKISNIRIWVLTQNLNWDFKKRKFKFAKNKRDQEPYIPLIPW